MAGRANTVTINILGDASDAQRAIAQVDSSMGGLSSSVSNIGRRLASGLAIVGTAFSGVAVGAVTLGVKTAASMETAKIGFETMLGSAEKANAFLGDLQKFAASTPFEFPELQTAASSLISVGVETRDVIPIMRTLGNVTSGMGTGAEGVKRATVALQQMSAAGRITGEDLNQLRDAGVPVFDLLAAATGKSKEEVAALAQAGKLGKAEMEQLFEALRTGKGLERFNGLMEKQSQSLSGLFSTLKDTVTMGLAGAVQPLIPLLSAAIPRAADLASAAFAKVTPLLANFVKGVSMLPGVVAGAGVMSNDFAEVIDLIGGNTGRLIPVVYGLQDVLGDVWTVVRDGILPVFSDFYSAMPSFLTPLGLARDVLGWVADNAVALQPILAALLGGFMAFKTVATVIRAVELAQLAWNAAMAMNPVGAVVVELAALVAGLVYAYNNVAWFRDGVNAAFSGIAAAARWVAAVFAGVWDGIVAGFVWVRDSLRSIANWLVANVYNRLIDAGNGLIRGLNIVNTGPDIPYIPRIPALADGGIVTGPTVAMIGEAGPEAVVPLSRGAGMGLGSQVTVNFNGVTTREAADQVVRILEQHFARGGALGNGRGGSLAPA